MIELYDCGAYLVNGDKLVKDCDSAASEIKNLTGKVDKTQKFFRRAPGSCYFENCYISQKIPAKSISMDSAGTVLCSSAGLFLVHELLE